MSLASFAELRKGMREVEKRKKEGKKETVGWGKIDMWLSSSYGAEPHQSLGWDMQRVISVPASYHFYIRLLPLPISSTLCLSPISHSLPLVLSPPPHTYHSLGTHSSLLTPRLVSRWDRILIFSGCNLGAAACFIICFFLFPIVAVRPRKFAIL